MNRWNISSFLLRVDNTARSGCPYKVWRLSESFNNLIKFNFEVGDRAVDRVLRNDQGLTNPINVVQ